MSRSQAISFLLAASAMALAVAVRPTGAQTPALTPCTIRGLDGDVRCGTVVVPENPRKPNERTLELFVVVARATGAERSPDPFLLLAGGPGQAASEMGPFASEAFGKVREARDLVLIDARGTGRSNPLACALVRTNAQLAGWTIYPADEVRACRDSLSKRADLTQYTTANIADDIEAVRRAFGWPTLNFYGTSYGSRLALTFARRHPSSVRSMVLKAIAPPTMIAPMNYAEDAEAAFALFERDCRADSACARAFPSLRADLDTILHRAASGRVLAVMPASDQRRDSLPISRDAVAATLVGAMQSAGTRSQLPQLLRTAASGNSESIAGLILQYRRQLNAGIAMGMHLSVSCADDGHHLDLARASATDRQTFLGSSRVRMLAEACAAWVPMPETPGVTQPVRSTVPVLLVSGEVDPNTPPRWGEDALRTLPNGRHVVLRGVSHGWSNVARCGADFVAAFERQASARDLDVSCAAASSAPPFQLPAPR
jgi:pimeloyl-ACP methyl ester carboxylesterase